MYDCCFYIPEHKAEALAMVKHAERPHRRWGLSFKQHIRLPNADRSLSENSGTLIMASYYGVEGVPYSEILTGLMLEVIKPGLIVGNFETTFWERDNVKNLAKIEKENEAKQEKQRAKQKLIMDEENAKAKEDAKRRYYLTGARIAGLQNPEQLPINEIMDATLWLALIRPVPSINSWLEETVSEQNEPIDDGIDDPEIAVAMSLAAVGYSRREKVAHG